MKKIISLFVVATFVLGIAFTVGCGRPNENDEAWYEAKLTKQESDDRLARAKDMSSAYATEYDTAVARIDELDVMHAELHAERNASETAKGVEITPLYHTNDAPPTWE